MLHLGAILTTHRTARLCSLMRLSSKTRSSHPLVNRRGFRQTMSLAYSMATDSQFTASDFDKYCVLHRRQYHCFGIDRPIRNVDCLAVWYQVQECTRIKYENAENKKEKKSPTGEYPSTQWAQWAIYPIEVGAGFTTGSSSFKYSPAKRPARSI
jgi:hypothetical protein